MPQRKKSSPTRLMYKDIILAFHEHGLDHVKKMHHDKRLRRNVMKACLEHFESMGRVEREAPLVAWLQEALQRGRGKDAPALGETRKYKPTPRGETDVPILRVPLHYMNLRGRPSVTFNKNQIIIQGAP